MCVTLSGFSEEKLRAENTVTNCIEYNRVYLCFHVSDQPQMTEHPYASAHLFLDHFSYFLLKEQGAPAWQRLKLEQRYEKKPIFVLLAGKYHRGGISPLTCDRLL